MDQTQRLLEHQRIATLKARYFRYIDTKQWDQLGDVFTANASMAVPSASFVVEGRASIVDAIREALAGVVTVHHGHMPEIEILDEAHATGIWAMEDLLIYPAGGPTATLRGYGHYAEEYVKVDGEWRIERLHLSRLHTELAAHLRDSHPVVAGP